MNEYITGRTNWQQSIFQNIFNQFLFRQFVNAMSCLFVFVYFCRFFDDIKIIHFLGSIKPWTHRYDQVKNEVTFYSGADPAQYGSVEFVKKWWQMYCGSLPTEETHTGSVSPL